LYEHARSGAAVENASLVIVDATWKLDLCSDLFDWGVFAGKHRVSSAVRNVFFRFLTRFDGRNYGTRLNSNSD
jgi:hypothetical protein